MGRTLKQIMAARSPERRRKVKARAAELIAEELSLRDLRRAMEKTQAALAKELGIGQEAVSRIERRSDLLLSTLQLYLSRIGGELELRVTFDHRPPVVLTQFKEDDGPGIKMRVVKDDKPRIKALVVAKKKEEKPRTATRRSRN
jgi:transcriptional regulator with XRE-family HTH domain